ncbi:MAG: Fe-S cluster assembly protein SufD [Acetobacteraceae bacterium]
MSATLQQTAENFSARYRGLAPRLPGPPAPRRRAAAWFEGHGFPDIRNEAWRFTSLRPLAGMVFSRPADHSETQPRLLQRLPPTSAPLLVFVNGRMRADLSHLPADGQAGLEITSFANAPSFGNVPDSETEPLSALNTMLAEDGARIVVPPATDGHTLVLLHLATGDAAQPPATHPRHQVRIDCGARLTLIEIALGDGLYLHNPMTEIVLGERAKILHLRLQDESPIAFHLGMLRVALGADSSYDGTLLVHGGRISRSELHAAIAGDRARFTFDAAQILGAEQLADITTVVRHLSRGASSRQTIRNVLTERAHGVFQGLIAVDRLAQKTDGYQMNKALLLSDGAQINTKPELEIFADDVKCSHGATVGALDSDQLFYLQSRGVPKDEARAILVNAFLSEMLEAVPDAWARALLEATVESWWKERPL